MSDFTGNVLCFFDPGAHRQLIVDVHAATGLRAADFAEAFDAVAVRDPAAPALLAPRLGVAVIRGVAQVGAQRLQNTLRARVRRERWLALPYLRDDAPTDLTLDQPAEAVSWALTATGVDRSRLGGGGVKVAILDSGIDDTHPDVSERFAARTSFVFNSPSADDNIGHGTHCAGTLFGPRQPASGPRYGVAPDVELFVGRVVNDEGRAAESSLIAGMEWAMEQRCRVISLSVGERPQATSDPDYDAIGARVLAAGCLIITAAGNDSRRPESIAPVRAPADSVTFFAVGAASRGLRPLYDSNGGLRDAGGELNIAAPGAGMRSAWLGGEYRTKAGTSTATPVVAGIAALLLEQQPALDAAALWNALVATAATIDGVPARDFGAGVVRV